MLNGPCLIVFSTFTLMTKDNKAFGFCYTWPCKTQVWITKNVTPLCSNIRVQIRCLYCRLLRYCGVSFGDTMLPLSKGKVK